MQPSAGVPANNHFRIIQSWQQGFHPVDRIGVEDRQEGLAAKFGIGVCQQIAETRKNTVGADRSHAGNEGFIRLEAAPQLCDPGAEFR